MGSLLLDDRMIGLRVAKPPPRERATDREEAFLFGREARTGQEALSIGLIDEFRCILGTQYEREAFAVVENLR